jgi:hypothetical protein
VRDYVAPPLALSVEEEKGEVNFSRGESIPAAELWKALSLTGSPPTQSGVGYCQPNPYARGKHLSLWCAVLGFGALVVAAVFLDTSLPHESVLRMDVALKDENVAVSEPFTLVSSSQAVEVRASAQIESSWAGLELALIDEESGDAHVADLEVSHFSGYDDGESWSEGSRSASAVLGSVPRGTYVLRAEVTLDPASARNAPPTATIEIVRGVFTWAPLVFAALTLWIPALFLTLTANGFERRRWADSDESDDEDD